MPGSATISGLVAIFTPRTNTPSSHRTYTVDANILYPSTTDAEWSMIDSMLHYFLPVHANPLIAGDIYYFDGAVISINPNVKDEHLGLLEPFDVEIEAETLHHVGDSDFIGPVTGTINICGQVSRRISDSEFWVDITQYFRGRERGALFSVTIPANNARFKSLKAPRSGVAVTLTATFSGPPVVNFEDSPLKRIPVDLRNMKYVLPMGEPATPQGTPQPNKSCWQGNRNLPLTPKSPPKRARSPQTPTPAGPGPTTTTLREAKRIRSSAPKVESASELSDIDVDEDEIPNPKGKGKGKGKGRATTRSNRK